MLVSRTAHNEKVQYHKLTDKALSTDDNNSTTSIEIHETDIDPLAPKGKSTSDIPIRNKIFDVFFIGNLLSLPSHVSVFGIRSATTNDSQSTNSLDNQRAMKQLELSNKIQTGLELKIDALKKEIRE